MAKSTTDPAGRPRADIMGDGVRPGNRLPKGTTQTPLSFVIGPLGVGDQGAPFASRGSDGTELSEVTEESRVGEAEDQGQELQGQPPQQGTVSNTATKHHDCKSKVPGPGPRPYRPLATGSQRGRRLGSQ